MINQSFIIPIIKVTDSCNFRCNYCYYAQRHANSRLMTIDEAKHIIKSCFDYNIGFNNNRMRIIFHGGEPLLQPLSFYQRMLEYEAELSQTVDGFEFYNSIQTNGYLIDDEWIAFLAKHEFDLGISIDGYADINQHYGEDGPEACTKKVLDNIRKLNDNGIPFGIISVITNEHTKDPQKMYDFCVENNIHDLSLNYCYSPDTEGSVLNENLIPFVEKLFDLYFSGSYDLNVREFNEFIAKQLGYSTDTCDRSNCGQYMAFDYLGNAFFCDSEYDKGTSVGNIKSQSLYQIVDSFDYLEKIYNCRKVFNEYCRSCRYLSFCGGGCHRYDLKSENTYTHNYFCDTHKALIDHIGNRLRNLDIDSN